MNNNKLKYLYEKSIVFLNSSLSRHNYLIVILSFVLSIYPIIMTNKPSLIYEIEKSNNSLNEEIYEVRVFNNGDINLKNTDFDQTIPWGLKIVNGQIKNKKISINSDELYLKNSDMINVLSNNQIKFRKLFLDAGDSFFFKLILIKEKDEKISFVSTGKISGLKAIEINPFFVADVIIGILEFLFTFICYLVLLLLFVSFPFIVKEIYKFVFINRKADKIFKKNKNKFKGFEEVEVFRFLFKFYSSDLNTIKQLIIDKEDILDYHNFKTTGKGNKDEYYYDDSEAKHQVKKGGADKDEKRVYLISTIYFKLKKYLSFQGDKLVIKNEEDIINYIDLILKNKKGTGSVNSYAFIMN